MINIWFLLGPVPTYRMGNGCNAIQNRLSFGRAFVCFACYVCVYECVACEHKGLVTACVWPREIKEQIGLQITTAPQHPNMLWPLSDYHPQQQWPWTQWSSWYWLWRDITYQTKEHRAAGREALVCTKWWVFKWSKYNIASKEKKKIKISRNYEINLTWKIAHLILAKFKLVWLHHHFEIQYHNGPYQFIVINAEDMVYWALGHITTSWYLTIAFFTSTIFILSLPKIKQSSLLKPTWVHN